MKPFPVSLSIQGAVIPWAVRDEPNGVSVNTARNVLVTCPEAGKIKEFKSFGDLLREISVADEISIPWHTIQLTGSDQMLLLCHSVFVTNVHRVCVVSADGREVVNSHGGQPGLPGANATPYKLHIFFRKYFKITKLPRTGLLIRRFSSQACKDLQR